MVRKCAVSECLSEEGRSQDRGVTFHKIPLHSDIRPKWMSLCRIPEDKYNIKVIHVCSRHFLNADFCHFKGKKYMLKQGVLPRVFPWNKLKKSQAANQSQSIKKEPTPDDATETMSSIIESIKSELPIKEEIKEEVQEEIRIKEEFLDLKEQIQSSSGMSYTLNADDICNIKNDSSLNSSTIEQRGKSVQTSTGTLNFAINTRLEALDFNQAWLPARIIEIDYEEDEVLIHFEKSPSKYDEWISMSSSRLRSMQSSTKKAIDTYAVGENCTAYWTDTRKFAARVTRVVDKDTYEVQFDDGYVKILKAHKLSKLNTKSSTPSAPLFDPVKGTKQERRDKKRRLNVTQLFRKRAKIDAVVGEESGSIEATEEAEIWVPKWEQGQPVGIDSTIETSDGPKKSILVTDPNLPPDWQKHLVLKNNAFTVAKWESILLSPDGRTISNKLDLKSYLKENPHLTHSEKIFNLSAYKCPNKNGSRRATCSSDTSPAIPVITESVPETAAESQASLKIPFIDDAYMCPIDGCGKSFRRVNLAQMHVKHYHPEFTKFLDCTPNVADLAYARTVGDSLEKSPDKLVKTPVRLAQKNVTPKSTPRSLNSPPVVQQEDTTTVTNQHSTELTNAKDSEIIKLLNNKIIEESLPKYPPGLPSSMYPEIKLKDLLNKSEGIPRRDDINLKSMIACTSRPTGIKTLLPVVRPPEIKKEPKTDEMGLVDQELQMKPNKLQAHKNLKRKRHVSEILNVVKKESENIVPTQDVPKESIPNPDYIVEGGKLIKIVRMKREEIINCTCGVTEEDGLMIQCEVCLCWQHAYCNNIERENQVPEKYICYICQNPARQRSSRKYYHDQDWLKMGTLPVGNYHCKDNEALKKRFEKLKKVHDLTGGLLELKDFMHSLQVKIKIAQAKNHPKLYLWSKPWEKQPLPEKQEIKTEDEKPNLDFDVPNKHALKSESSTTLLPIKDEELNSLSKLDLNALVDVSVSAPQPEAAIESADCQVNLLEHIAHSQTLLEERLNSIEKEIDVLDPAYINTQDKYVRACQTVQMLLKDLGTLKELCHTSIL